MATTSELLRRRKGGFDRGITSKEQAESDFRNSFGEQQRRHQEFVGSGSRSSDNFSANRAGVAPTSNIDFKTRMGTMPGFDTSISTRPGPPPGHNNTLPGSPPNPNTPRDDRFDARAGRRDDRFDRINARKDTRDENFDEFRRDPIGTLQGRKDARQENFRGGVDSLVNKIPTPEERIERAQNQEQLRADLGLGPEFDPFITQLLGEGGANQESANILKGIFGSNGPFANQDQGAFSREDLVSRINSLGDFQQRPERGATTQAGGGSAQGGDFERRETGLLDRLEGLGDPNKLGGNVQNIFSGLQQGDTDLEKQINQNALTSLQGGLTAPQSQFADAARAARLPAFQDTLRSVKEAAGQQRGIGGGRFQKQLQRLGSDFQNQSLADITALQQQAATQAPDIASIRRGQDINLTGIAAGLGQSAQGTQLGAAGQLGNQLTNIGQQQLGRGNLALQEELGRGKLDLNRDVFDRDTQIGSLDRALQESQFGRTLGQNQAFGEANLQRGIGNDLIGNQIGVGNLLQGDKRLDQNQPNRVESAIDNLQNIGNTAFDTGLTRELFPNIDEFLRAPESAALNRQPDFFKLIGEGGLKGIPKATLNFLMNQFGGRR